MQAPQLQEKELIGQTDALQQKPLNTEESAGEPLDQETAASARQAENRQQLVVASNVESRVTEQQTLVQSVGGSRPPEQQKNLQQTDYRNIEVQQETITLAFVSHPPEHQRVVQQAGEARITEQKPVVPAIVDSRVTNQQLVAQGGGSRLQEQHQQATVQEQVVQSQGTQDVSAPNKPLATAQVQPFRFAQSQEVAVAAADGGKRGRDFSGQQQSHPLSQPSVSMDGMLDEALVEHVAPLQQAPAADENHQLAVQGGARPQPAVIALTGAADLPKQVPGEQVARQVAERLVSHEIRPGSDQISLKLSPEHLGNLQLNLRMEEKGLKLEIIAEQRGVREALMRQGDELKESLARQNIRIDSFEVSTGTLGGQTQQQQREWRQMNPEQRLYHAQYASAARDGSAAQDISPGMFYFEPQYQSTIDVRF